MFGNILRSEFYKQYSKKTSFILPLVIFLLFIIVPFIYFTTFETLIEMSEAMFEDYGSLQISERDYSQFSNAMITLYISGIVMFLLFIFTTFIVPLITPISVYGQDYSNNVISNTIALGGKRVHIFIAKFIVSNVHCALYYLAGVIGTMIAILLFAATSSVDLSDLFDDFANIEIEMLTLLHWFSNIAMAYTLTMSVAILAITLTKNFVGAFFSSLAFHFVLYFIPITFIMAGFLNTIEYDQEVISLHGYFLITNIYMIFMSALLLGLSLLKFVKTEY